MVAKGEQSSGTPSASMEPWQRRQRQRTASPEHTLQQRLRGIQTTSAARSVPGIVEDGPRNPTTASASARIDLPARSGRILASTGNIQQQSRSESGSGSESSSSSPGRPAGTANRQADRLATSRDGSLSRGNSPQQLGDTTESQVQRSASTERQVVPTTTGGSPESRITASPASAAARNRRKERIARSRKRIDKSIDADGLQFYPEPVYGRAPPPRASNVPWPRYRHKAAKIGIGIESEFLLQATRREGHPVASVRDFGEFVATNHNLRVPSHMPRMYSYLENQEISEEGLPIAPEARKFDEWSLTFDATMYTSEEPCESLRILLSSNSHLPSSLTGSYRGNRDEISHLCRL